MAVNDLIITAANVVGKGTNSGIAGAAISAGDILYKDADDSNKLKLAINNDAADVVAVGIAVNDAAIGQPVSYDSSGVITLGSGVLVAGEVGQFFGVSDVAGKIAPVSEITTGMYMTLLGWGVTTSTFKLNIVSTGLAVG